MTKTLHDVVDAEARHDWLDHRRELKRDATPDPTEYRDLEP